MQKRSNYLRENFIFYVAGLLIILGIKCYYRQADSDSLLWILAPTAHWVGLLGKIPFTYVSGAGYVNHSLRMVIAPSCSGVRFMVITFAMLVFSFIHIITSQQGIPAAETARPIGSGSVRSGMLRAKARGLGWIAASAFFSWLFTVLVNGLRIMIAIYLPMYLEDRGLMGGALTQDRLHTVIGVVVYFTALLVIYRLAGWFVQGILSFPFMRKFASPVFWYLAFTLGIPFLNRACRESDAEFAEFAVLVTGCCAIVLLPYMIVFSCRHSRCSRKQF